MIPFETTGLDLAPQCPRPLWGSAVIGGQSGAWLPKAPAQVGLALCLMVTTLAGGCTFDQGERIEMNEFVKLIEEEDDRELMEKDIPPDPELLKHRLPETYLVGHGDVIEITVMGLMEPRRPYGFLRRIRQDGTISLPMLEGPDAKIQVEGRKLEEVEELVQEKYSPAYIKDAQPTVMVASYKTVPVTVIGHVNQPGVLQLKRDELNVLMAIARAGWIRETSNGEITVKPATGGKETFQLWMAPDVSRALNRTIEKGDVIEVERRPSDAVYVTGLVRSPGPIGLQTGQRVTLKQVIANAGGLDSNIDPREATLIRLSATGEPVYVRVDFNRLYNNTDPDIIMKPGDILDVHHSDRTRAFEFIQKFIRVGAGLDLSYNPFFMGLNPFRSFQN